MIMRCPKCKGTMGYYEKIIMSYQQYFTFNGDIDFASENTRIKGGKRKYCAECDRDITIFIPKR